MLGLDFTRFYLMTAGGELYQVSSSDGSFSLIGTSELYGVEEMSDLATDPTTGTLYAVSTDCWGGSSLYTINPTTAAATRIGAIATDCMVAIAFDHSGTLYGYDIEIDRMYQIQTSNALAIDQGELGFDANYSQGMDCDPTTDICYLFAFDGTINQPLLWTFDPATSVISQTGRLGSVSPGSMVSLGDAVIVSPLFADGFESNDTSAWSATVP
jgi:hypothetical protein